MSSILISTRSFGKIDPAPLRLLREAGLEPVLNPHGRTLEVAESIELLKGKVGLIAGTEKLNDDVFSRAPELRVVSRVGTGMNNVDAAAAERRGIKVYNTPDSPARAVAELTLGLILACLRRVAEADRQVRSGGWDPVMGRLLFRKTVGIVGLGRVGRYLTDLLVPFETRVLACDHAAHREFVRSRGVVLTDLDELLREADVVTIHVPLIESTRGLLDRSRLGAMKPGACLVNTARGGLLDEDALREALQSGRLSAAALDVFETEPYRGPLAGLPNVVLSPHMGSSAEETRVMMELESARNLIEGLAAAATGVKP